ARFHRAGKRDLRRETSPAPQGADESSNAFEAVAPEPTPAQAVEFAEEFERLLGSLDAEEKRVLELKLEGRKTQEIAEMLHRTDRWIRKVMERIRQRLGSEPETEEV